MSHREVALVYGGADERAGGFFVHDKDFFVATEVNYFIVTIHVGPSFFDPTPVQVQLLTFWQDGRGSKITFLRVDVKVAIDFKRFDLFGEVESLFYFARRDLSFLAINYYANRHGEAFYNLLILK